MLCFIMVIKASPNRRNNVSKAIRSAINTFIPEKELFQRQKAAYLLVVAISVVMLLIAVSIFAATQFITADRQLTQATEQTTPDFESCRNDGKLVRTAEGTICIAKDGNTFQIRPTVLTPTFSVEGYPEIGETDRD